MRTRTRFIYIVMAVSMLIGSASLLSTTAHAQVACLVTNVFNGSGCAVNLCMYDAAGNQRCFPIPNAIGPTPIALGVFFPIGVVSAGGNRYAFVPPPNPGCSPCFRIGGPAGTCCVIVCYDAATCTIRILACGPPCLP